jgi:hypothetical protein
MNVFIGLKKISFLDWGNLIQKKTFKNLVNHSKFTLGPSCVA